jgi:ribonuclease P protein component
MISRQHRFHGYKSLNFVYRRGATMRDYHLALRYTRNPRRSTHRVAVIVSRKVDKSAVRRNRIRRRLYEVIRLHESAINDPYDILLTVFSSQLADMPAEKLTRIVLALCRKAGVIGVAVAPAQAAQRAIVTKEKEERH